MHMTNDSSARNQLERVLGPITAIAIVVGTTIGSGVFKKPAIVAQDVSTFGTAMAAWWLLAMLVIFGGLALAEVNVLFPRAGGNYVFLREAYGRNTFGQSCQFRNFKTGFIVHPTLVRGHILKLTDR